MQKTTSNSQQMARLLRNNQTHEESILWGLLRSRQINGARFRRQHPIGNYVVDFCAPKRKLIIELDGSQHLENAEIDEVRTKFLESLGYRVLRFWNNDVLTNLDGVYETIQAALDTGDET